MPSRTHLFMTGPLRPNMDFIVTNIATMKSLFGNVVTHILYWETGPEDEAKLRTLFDYVYPIQEPTDAEIYAKITGRFGQQSAIKTIEHWTLSWYKLFYGIRTLIDASTIDDTDVVIRVRTDLHMDRFDSSVLKYIHPNTYYFCPRINGGNACDWFGIARYATFKKIWYFETDTVYNEVIPKSWNAELLLKDMARTAAIHVFDINQYVKIGLCRSYDGTPTIEYMHP